MSGPQLHRFPVPPGADGERLDVFLARTWQDAPSRAQVQKLIRDGNVSIDGRVAKASQRVAAGQEVLVYQPPEPPRLLAAEALPLDIVYEDADVIVLNKPRGLVVHPAPGHETGTLVNALLAHVDRLSGIAGMARPGIVHRLDKDTTGLLLVAKTDSAHATLAAELKRQNIERRYLALVHGVPGEWSGLIEAPIGRDEKDRMRMAVTPAGKSAWTRFWVIATFGEAFSWLDVKLYTGRTHQIRVHLAYIGHPIAGDPVYGKADPSLELGGQALHAYRLAFTHPRTRERMRFTAPLPDDYRRLLQRLTRQYGMTVTGVQRPHDEAGTAS